MSAPWSPMMAPPLPLRSDAERDTCPHAYPAEECLGAWDRHLRNMDAATWAAYLAAGGGAADPGRVRA